MTRPIHEAGMKILQDKGYAITVGEWENGPSHEELIQALSNAPYDAVITYLTDTVDASLFTACPSAKLYTNYAVGFNNINTEDVKTHSIIATNTPGCAGRAVAEHTVALMISLTTRITEGDRYMRLGKYTGWRADLLIGSDLSGKTIGLIGLGDIGSQVAKMLAHGFGCSILYTDMAPNEALQNDCGARFVTKEELLREADIISLHVPLLPATTHLINAETIGMMKPGAIIINTSRGPVIDEKALVVALQNKRIAGAGVDVYEFEPTLSEGMVTLENIVMTPHIASARESVRIKMAEITANNIVSYFETGNVITPALK